MSKKIKAVVKNENDLNQLFIDGLLQLKEDLPTFNTADDMNVAIEKMANEIADAGINEIRIYLDNELVETRKGIHSEAIKSLTNAIMEEIRTNPLPPHNFPPQVDEAELNKEAEEFMRLVEGE